MKGLERILLGVLVIIGCQDKNDPLSQFEYSDGIYFEIVDTVSNLSENPYNEDNLIYKSGKEFFFNYTYQDSTGKEYLFKREGYELTPKDSITNSTISKVSLKAMQGFGMFGPDYNQTVTEYNYYLPNGERIYPRNRSGIVENEKNIWMHPFRNPCYFRLLQLGPFPYVQRPLEIGRKWKWSLKTGNHYDCDQWGEWEGIIENKYDYEIIGYEKLLTKLGEEECYVIKSKGEGGLGNTELISYFNEINGFVRMEYQNVNKSRLILELAEIKN